MMNKKNPLSFSFPTFMSPKEDFIKNEQQFNNMKACLNVHLDFLKNQMFCLKIKDFFKNNPEIEQISFRTTELSDECVDYIHITVYTNGNENVDAYNSLCRAMTEDDKNYLHDSIINGSAEFVVDKNNQEKAFADWMGAADFKKWHSLYTEENLLNLLPENILKPKKANRL